LRGFLIIASAAAFLTLGLVGILLFVRGPADRLGGDSQRVFDEMHSAYGRVRLPPGYILVHVESRGGIGLFQDQGPYEERVYTVENVPHIGDTFQAALAAAGFRIEPHNRCAFDARRGRVLLIVEYFRTPEPPIDYNGRPQCPSTSRPPRVYAWTILSEANEGPQPTATQARRSP
jgi:hypothetical protein